MLSPKSTMFVLAVMFAIFISTNASFSANITIDWDNGNTQEITLVNDAVFSFTNGKSGATYKLIIKQNGSGSGTVTWPTTDIKWYDGVPTISTTADAIDVVTFLYNGTDYLGNFYKNFHIGNSTFGGSGWVDDSTVVRLSTSTDRVGIGTTSPGAKLDVNVSGISGGENLLKLSVSDDNTSFLSVVNGTGGDGNFLPRIWGHSKKDDAFAIQLQGTVPLSQDIISTLAVIDFNAKTWDGTNYGTLTNKSLITFRNNNDTKVLIDKSGNVGIGTNAPNYKLSVAGGQIWGSHTGTAGNNNYDIADLVLGSNTETRNGYSGTNGSHIILRSSDKSSITAVDESNNLGQISYQNLKWTIGEDIGWGAQTIYTPGKVGIGTTSPDAQLSINDPGGNPTISLKDNECTRGKIYIGAGGDDQIYIDALSSGNGVVLRTNAGNVLTATYYGRVGIGMSVWPSNLLSIGDDLGTNAYAKAVVLGNSGGTSAFFTGQSASAGVEVGWCYNATPANAYALIQTYGGLNNLIFQRDNNAKVGIGMTSPGYQLQLSQNSAAKPTSNTWTVPSDRRLKTNIRPFTDGLNVILKLEPIRYYYNGKANMPTNEEGIGIIAQDVQKIAPYAVGTFKAKMDSTDKEPTELLDYHHDGIEWAAINAIKELAKQNEDMMIIINEQQKIIENLKNENKSQQQQINEISSLIQKEK